MGRKTPFSVRLGDAELPLEAGSVIADETRSEFVREAVKQRYRRLVDRERGERRERSRRSEEPTS